MTLVPNAPERTGMAPAEALVHAFCLGLSTGFYVWILDGPKTADHAIVKVSQPNLLAGLPGTLLMTCAGGILAAAALGLWPASRAWRGRLALGSCALYLASTSAAIGHVAIVLAPPLALLWTLGLAIRHEEPGSDAALVTLHTAMLGAALAFYHQWAWYRAGWEPFVDSMSALRTLLLGG